ncbi:MAG TPA: aminomethyl-transferring glycine dehydrogenase subunit GcvPB, partial [Candidatus Omnitrophota bacterium]|nr:aminomethyl-transferring glycine dehydrogenase subunit GcvPB [Candidatus Omnitrophota bacterium]
MELIFERSKKGRRAFKLPVSDVPEAKQLDKKFLRDKSAALPDLSELDVVRHFTNLSQQNFGVD